MPTSRALVLAVIVAAVAVLSLGCGRGFNTIAEGAAPDVQRLDGSSVAFAEVLATDRPTLIVYSTIWCERCRKERPHVEAWGQANAAKVKVISIVSGSPAAKVVANNKRYRLPVEHVPMLVDASGDLANHHGVHATPTLILLQRDGTEQGRYGSIEKVPLPGEAPEEASRELAPVRSDPPAESADVAPHGTSDGMGAAASTTTMTVVPAAASAAAFIPVERQGRVLGTSFHVVVLAPANRAGASDAAAAAIKTGRAQVDRLDRLLSEWRSNSEVSRLNREGARTTVAVGPELRSILKGARYVSNLTGGAFDITWKPLGTLWDRAEGADRWPSRKSIGDALKLVNPAGVIVDDAGARLAKDGVAIGVAGVAKGYIIDRWFLTIVKAGFKHVIVNIGGDLRTSGTLADGTPRTYLIADPYAPTRKFAGRIEVGAAAVATSGNYWRQRSLTGPQGTPTEVGHIIDPRTGMPPAFDGSVTVLTRDAAMADALATGLFILGPDRGLALAKRLKGVDAVFVTRDGLQATVPVAPVGSLRRQPTL